jgi:hypothetical protein
MWTGVWGGHTVSHARPELTSRWTTSAGLHAMASHKICRHYTRNDSVWGLEIYSHSFWTLALDGIRDQLHTGRFSPRGKSPRYVIEQEAGWAPERIWTLWRRRKSLANTISWISIPPPYIPWPSSCLTTLFRLQHTPRKTILVLLSTKDSLWLLKVFIWVSTVLHLQK